jgi:uncharacterized protein YkwD
MRVVALAYMASRHAAPTTVDGRRLSRWGLALAAVIALTGLLAAPASAVSAHASAAEVRLEADVVAMVNAVRAEYRLAPLRLDGGLDEAALQHTRQMLSFGYFAHTSPNGSPFWQRIERFYPASHFAVWQVGENLAWSFGGLDARETVAEWMESPPHRANLLSSTWQQIGVAVQSVGHGAGVYEGLPVTVVTVDFGIRADS